MASKKGTVMVTGANGGLGSTFVARLLKTPDLANNYTGLYTARKAASATTLKSKLNAGPKSHKYQILDLDLSSLADVRRAAGEINRRVAAGELPPIRVLILNAAYQDHSDITFTDDGYETSWHVNYLANQLLALLILQSMDKETGRIVIIGSVSHDIDNPANPPAGYGGLDGLFPGADELANGRFSPPGSGGGWLAGYRRYGASKLCTVMLMHELAHRLAEDPELSNIGVAGLDPGAMATGLTRRGDLKMKFSIQVLLGGLAPLVQWRNPNGFFRTMWRSAGDLLHISFGAAIPKSKALYLDGSEERQTSREARDEAKRRELWDYGLKAAGITGDDTVLQNWQ